MNKNNLDKTKNLLGVEKYTKELFEMIWPYEKLKIDINELDKVELPAAKIASFLFKAQLVEIELRGLLDSLDRFVELKSKEFPFYVKRKRNYKDLNLGQLKKELEEYQSEPLGRLMTILSLFKVKRDMFTHNLYLQRKDVKDLALEAERYKKQAEKSLELIKKIQGGLWESFK